jgi:hypothetical protein
MSFISSGNLSTPVVFPSVSRNPEAGTTLTEAICSKKKVLKKILLQIHLASTIKIQQLACVKD